MSPAVYERCFYGTLLLIAIMSMERQAVVITIVDKLEMSLCIVYRTFPFTTGKKIASLLNLKK